ncbi:hypothetical protein YC2023_071450 [Brassica napus]
MKWTMRFEEVKVVANGSGLVAAITSLNLLHIFSEGGLQVSSFAFYGLSCVTIDKHVISLGGPVVTATGCRDQLAVVTHVSDCLPSNEQKRRLPIEDESKMNLSQIQLSLVFLGDRSKDYHKERGIVLILKATINGDLNLVVSGGLYFLGRYGNLKEIPIWNLKDLKETLLPFWDLMEERIKDFGILFVMEIGEYLQRL